MNKMIINYLQNGKQRRPWSSVLVKRFIITMVILMMPVLLLGCKGNSFLLESLGARLLPSNNQTLELSRLPGGTYHLDGDHTAVIFEVNHLGFSNLVGRFRKVEGALTYNPDNASQSQAKVHIEAASIDTNVPALDEKLRAEGALNVARFADILMTVTALQLTDARHGKLTGLLTLRGVTKPLVMDVTFNGGATDALTGKYTLGFHASAIIKRSDYGFSLWAPAVGDEVIVAVRTEFIKDEK